MRCHRSFAAEQMHHMRLPRQKKRLHQVGKAMVCPFNHIIYVLISHCRSRRVLSGPVTHLRHTCHSSKSVTDKTDTTVCDLRLTNMAKMHNCIEYIDDFGICINVSLY